MKASGQSADPVQFQAIAKSDPYASICKPGDCAPVTGLYRAVHHPAHRETHNSVLREGEVMQACSVCGNGVTLLLIHAAPLLSEDPDFQP